MDISYNMEPWQEGRKNCMSYENNRIKYITSSVGNPLKCSREWFISYLHPSQYFFLLFIPFSPLSSIPFHSFHLFVLLSFLCPFLPFIYPCCTFISFPSKYAITAEQWKIPAVLHVMFFECFLQVLTYLNISSVSTTKQKYGNEFIKCNYIHRGWRTV
jgi:hypothetical protein